jgi:cold shock CspA family protein
MNAKKYKGILKTWKDDRGFGFIKPNDGTKKVLLNRNALLKEIFRLIQEKKFIIFQVQRIMSLQ